MFFILVALAFIVLKLLDLSFMASIGWPWIALPLGLASLWWALADKYGYTQKRAMDRMEAKKEARRQRALEALGQADPKRRR